VGFFGVFRVEYDLQQATTVAKVDENQIAMVASSMNPTRNRNL
jgi:hypothetical protein